MKEFKLLIVVMILISCSPSQQDKLTVTGIFPNGNPSQMCNNTMCIEFYQDGDTSAIYSHQRGVHHGEYLFFDSGNLRASKSIFDNGDLISEEEYYPNGFIKSKLSYRNGLQHGYQFYYDSLGKILRSIYAVTTNSDEMDIMEEVVFSPEGDTINDLSEDFLKYSIPYSIELNSDENLNVEFIDPHAEYFLVVYGFTTKVPNPDFISRNSQNLDTLIFSQKTFKIQLDASETGTNFLRGIIWNFDDGGDGITIISKAEYNFEFSYHVE